MSTVSCVICGARKGGTNNWWVLFEAESRRAVSIGHLEDLKQPSDSATVPFYLCGVDCLYRKLNGLLLPRARGSGNGEKPPELLETAAGYLCADPAAGPEDLGSRLIAFSPLRGIPRRGKDQKRMGCDTDVRSYAGMATPNGKVASARPRESAAVGQGVTINGLIQSDEQLSVNGELAGTLLLPNHRLTVGPSGKVRANVHAREVEVLGVIEGLIRADKVVVRKNARVVGDIRTLVLVIEEGGFFEGRSIKAPGSDTACQERSRHAVGT